MKETSGVRRSVIALSATTLLLFPSCQEQAKPSIPAVLQEIVSRITCPKCGFQKTEHMPTEACIISYTCTNCFVVLHPKSGDCCVYCSYGDEPCPPVQSR